MTLRWTYPLFPFLFLKTSLKIFYKKEKMKKSQGTEEHVPQAADIVEDDTDVDIDKTSFVC